MSTDQPADGTTGAVDVRPQMVEAAAAVGRALRLVAIVWAFSVIGVVAMFVTWLVFL